MRLIGSAAACSSSAAAAERAKSPRGADVVPILRKGRVETVLGSIGWNEKGTSSGPSTGLVPVGGTARA